MNQQLYHPGLLLEGDSEMRYRYFLEMLVVNDEVWTVRDGGGVPIFENPTGESMPFWATRADAEALCTGRLRKAAPVRINLGEFVDRWLPGMARDGVNAEIQGLGSTAIILGAVQVLDELSQLAVSRSEGSSFSSLTAALVLSSWRGSVLGLPYNLVPIADSVVSMQSTRPHAVHGQVLSGDTSNVLDAFAETVAWANEIHMLHAAHEVAAIQLDEINAAALWARRPSSQGVNEWAQLEEITLPASARFGAISGAWPLIALDPRGPSCVVVGSLTLWIEINRWVAEMGSPDAI